LKASHKGLPCPFLLHVDNSQVGLSLPISFAPLASTPSCKIKGIHWSKKFGDSKGQNQGQVDSTLLRCCAYAQTEQN
jgi:hypothetical protein